MRVDVVIAWPDRYLVRRIELVEGALVADALRAAALDLDGESRACAIHGLLARPEQPLRDGDRLELLRPLLIDPKEARRRRAKTP
ncbi:MAG: RnfH family protein [Pseudomonas sp.]